MVDWNRDTPWRQGHVLTVEAAAAFGLLHASGPGQTIVIVATHDCDLAQSPESEPLVEVIVGRCIDKLDGNFTHAKTARKLHVELSGASPSKAEFEATGKTQISKAELAAFGPQAGLRLSLENVAIFQYWLASRYRRSAFPDEFERRLKEETKLAKKIAKVLEPHGDMIAGIFFDVDHGAENVRVGEDDPYVLDIYVMHPAEPEFLAAEAAANSAATEIEKAFRDKLFAPTKTWKHIELRFCEVISESVLTYQQFKMLKRWRLEHISLGSEPQLPVLAD